MGKAPRKTHRPATGSSSILSYFAPNHVKPVPIPDDASSRSSLSPLSSLEPATPTDPSCQRVAAADGPGTPISSSSQATPPPARPIARQPVRRDAEIAASDDDDGFDDSDEFEPLEALLAPRAGPTTPTAKRVNRTQLSTPDRRPGSLFSSPLTIQPRVVRHFAMDDLLKDAKTDFSTQESYKRLQSRQDDEAVTRTNAKPTGDALRRTLMATVGDEQDDHRLDKVVRAVERTEGPGTKEGWYFFRPDAGSAPQPNRYPFPAKVLADIYGDALSLGGPQDLDLRVLHFSLKLRRDALPDELFLWMLDEMCVEESDLRRDEMCKILHLCPSSSIPGQITPSYLEGLFMRLGASTDIQTVLGGSSSSSSSKELQTVVVPEDGFYGGSWRCISSVLDTLVMLSRDLDPDAMRCCLQAVLAISVDPELFHDPEVLLRCRELLLSISSAFPPAEWGKACERLTTFIYKAFPYPPMRLRSLQFLPTSTREMHALRRRMAVVFFFDDLSLASQPPDATFSLHDACSHLRSATFKIRPDTDYAALRALLVLLDMAVDTGPAPEPDDDNDALTAAAETFDAEVDRITLTLRHLGRSINDTGMKSILPMEAKMVMDWVGERLTHSVRTRPKPKISIYDLPDRPMADVHLPQQQNLMKRFLQSRRGGAGGEAGA